MLLLFFLHWNRIYTFYRDQWEAKVQRSQEEFDSISKAIKKELDRFEIQRVKDFKAGFISYLEAQLKAQEKVSLVHTNVNLPQDLLNNVYILFLQIIENWEAYIPEAKAIA